MTSDHLLPKSWYPVNEREDFEKWQIPSCKDCNSKYGRIENNLLLSIGHCINPESNKSNGIVEKAIRARNPNYAKNEKDREHRLLKKEKLLRRLVKVESVPKESLFPQFNINDQNNNSSYGILLSKKELEMFGEKIVRGITYIAHNIFIYKEYEISIIFQHDENILDVRAQISKFGKTYECGKAINVLAAFVEDVLPCGMFEIEIWGRLKMYGFVESKTMQNFP